MVSQLNLTTSQRLKFPGRSFGHQLSELQSQAQATQPKKEKKAEDPSLKLDRYGEWWGTTQTFGASANLNFDWKLIDPKRVPDIAAARDEFEKAKNNYLISTCVILRLQTAEIYFNLQKADSNVLTFKAAVQASLIQVRDARARCKLVWQQSWMCCRLKPSLLRDQEVCPVISAISRFAKPICAKL